MNSPRIIVALLVFLAALGSLRRTFAADRPAPSADVALVFTTAWKGERITLPPAFAPAMKLRGVEEIRFAPAMFDASSASFFSYIFAFAVPQEQALTPQFIRDEILAYYRGLSMAILQRKGVDPGADKFTFKLEPTKEPAATPAKVPASKNAAQYHGELSWTEPFVTAKPQILHFEIQSWSDPATARNYLLVCTSPRPRSGTDEVWQELRAIRSGFEVKAVR